MPSNIPTMRALLDDPLYRPYAKRVPREHPANKTGDPWQLWVDAGSGRWLTRTYTDYREVWPTFIAKVRDHTADPTIVSRRVFYAPPGEWYRVKVRLPQATLKHPEGYRVEWRWRQKFFWPEIDLHWCGRCRRPSYWMPLFDSHHALRRMPAVTTEDNHRCIICGIRWIAQPDISQMTRMEAVPV